MTLEPLAIADEARAAFLRTLRHELRTPINHIVGYSELLLESAEDFPDSDLSPDLHKIDQAGKALLALVNDYFGSSRAGAAEDIDLHAVCHELRTPLNSVIGYSDLLKEEASDAGHDDLVPDLDKIHAAGTHLLGLVEVVLGLSQPRGSGLSSALDAAAVTARSSREAIDSRAAEVGAHDRAVTAEGPTLYQGKLLVVDDDEGNRDMLSRRLERLGCTVVCAENGREALEALRKEPFDLLLLDIMMPEMNGYQVLEHLQADPALRHLPVIVLSASGDTEDAVRCIAMGADDFLPKPFDAVLLRARVGACLEKKRLRDQEVLYLRQIEEARRRSDALLHVILPDEIVAELKATDTVRPRRYEHVAVLFCDIVEFTPYCEQHQPHEVVASLQLLVEAFEEITMRHDMQKIKTIGDAFMAAAGLLRPLASPVLTSVRAGLEMIEAARTLPTNWSVRVGIHVGPVVAGILGHRQYLFDLFGDTVNTAARVESHGIPDAITLSRAAWDEVARECDGLSLGLVEVKGKGSVELFRFCAFADRERVPS